MSRSTFHVIYRGPSRFDGKPIVAYLAPYTAAKVGRDVLGLTVVPLSLITEPGGFYAMLNRYEDKSVCGACPRRASVWPGPKCYVPNSRQGWGITTVAGRRADALLHGRVEVPPRLAGWSILRSAVYGDAAALPVETWRQLEDAVTFPIVGYTHAWTTSPHLRLSHMASCETIAEARDAQLLGWRTFRVGSPGEPPSVRGEGWCPASHEWRARGKPVLSCDACLLCTGSAKGKRNVVIWDHAAVNSNVYKKALTSLENV